MANEKLTLICPVRGKLRASGKSGDGLRPTEEFHRVEAIRYLVDYGYPSENLMVEPVLKKFGSQGRNSFRADFAVLDRPISEVDSREVDVLLEHTILLCEVKRDNAASDYVRRTQVSPLLDFARLSRCVGLYWDNVEQRVFWQEVKGGKRTIR